MNALWSSLQEKKKTHDNLNYTKGFFNNLSGSSREFSAAYFTKVLTWFNMTRVFTTSNGVVTAAEIPPATEPHNPEWKPETLPYCNLTWA